MVKDSKGTNWVYNAENGMLEGTSLDGKTFHISPKVIREGYAAKIRGKVAVTPTETALISILNSECV